MVSTVIILAILSGILVFFNAKESKHGEGFKVGLKQLLRVLPVVLIAFVFSGMLEALIPDAFIQNWLSREAGIKGILVGTIGGMLLAMGPYASFPIIASMYGAGASLGTTVSLITGWTLLGLSRLPYEGGFLGFRFTLLRMAFSFPFCLAVGFIAHIIDTLNLLPWHL